MTTRIELKLTFDGSFNVGAGALGGSLADNPLTRDARGLPMVPASAFKGRLRHQIEQLVPHLRADSRVPCGAPVAEAMCQGDEPPCPVCQLFGSPWQPGKLIFSDLTLIEPEFLLTADSPPGDLRPGVGLSRHRKVAEDRLLYTTEVFLPGTPITLAGTITGSMDESELDLLQAGLRSILTIGRGKTRGLGWFDLSFTIRPGDPEATSYSSEIQDVSDEEEVIIRLRLMSSLLVGSDTSEAYYKTTRGHISGRVLRGALARCMLPACHHQPDEPHKDCDFGRLFVSETPPVFEYLYPTTGREFSFPAPLTARSCKYHPGFKDAKRPADRGHGVGDILIRQAIFEHMLLDEHLVLPMLYQPQCSACDGEVDHFDGNIVMIRLGQQGRVPQFQYDNVTLPIRRASRTAINRQRAVAADGQLYTLEMIEPMDSNHRPVVFQGRLRGRPEQIMILSRWLQRISAIGQGQTRGLGQVKIEVLPFNEANNPLPPLTDRLAQFNEAVRREWAFYQRIAGAEPLSDHVNYFSLTLLSPACLTSYNMPVTTPTPEMLGFTEGINLVRAFANYQMIGGWHLGAELPRRTQLATTMGSVFLYRSEKLPREELIERLSELEEYGLGSDFLRRQGFGRVVACFPFHYQSEVIL